MSDFPGAGGTPFPVISFPLRLTADRAHDTTAIVHRAVHIAKPLLRVPYPSILGRVGGSVQRTKDRKAVPPASE